VTGPFQRDPPPPWEISYDVSVRAPEKVVHSENRGKVDREEPVAGALEEKMLPILQIISVLGPAQVGGGGDRGQNGSSISTKAEPGKVGEVHRPCVKLMCGR